MILPGCVLVVTFTQQLIANQNVTMEYELGSNLVMQVLLLGKMDGDATGNVMDHLRDGLAQILIQTH